MMKMDGQADLVIEKYGKVIGNEFIIGQQRYKTVVLPKHIKLFDNTAKLLKEFKDNGGIVTTADFIISEPKKAIAVNNIEQQGYPFFSGEVTLKKELFLKSIEPIVLEFLQKKSNVVSISINGKELPNIMWKPYKIDITEYLKEGINIIEVTLVNSLRNMLGPHHCENGELYKVRPVSFFKEKSIWGDRGRDLWNDAYCFAEFGIE